MEIAPDTVGALRAEIIRTEAMGFTETAKALKALISSVHPAESPADPASRSSEWIRQMSSDIVEVSNAVAELVCSTCAEALLQNDVGVVLNAQEALHRARAEIGCQSLFDSCPVSCTEFPNCPALRRNALKK